MNANNQPLRKKARISAVSLAKAESQSRLRAGKLRELAWSHQPVISGELRHVCMEGIVIDFRKGRESGKLSNCSFVTFADGTGTCSLGTYSAASGIDNFCIPDDEISDETRCFFQVGISGNVAWYPSKKDPMKPIILVRGTFKKLEGYPTTYSKFLKLFYPTCDVLDLISKEEFAESSKYTTPAVLGEISSVVLAPNSTTVSIGMEDLIGAAMVKINKIEEPSSFIDKNNLTEGKFILLEGPLGVSKVNINNENYACVSVDEEDMGIIEISNDEMEAYKQALCTEPDDMFQGVVPNVSSDSEN